MKKNIEVSILITFYNQAEYVEQTLESVINQRFDKEYEILCGDDGSTDGTYEKLLEYEKLFPFLIKVFRMKRDYSIKYEPIERVSENRLYLMRQANGKYISFLDGDDFYIDNNKIALQYSILENNYNCVGCGHPVKAYFDNKKNNYIISNIYNRALIIDNKEYWRLFWFHADSFLFRNILLDNKLININNLFFDDNLITCYFIKFGKVIYIPNVMVAYRQIEDSSWNSRDELEKAFVNVKVFFESLRVLGNGYRLFCFIRCYESLKIIYNYRNKNINYNEIKFYNNISQFNFIKEIINYKNSNLIFKIRFELKYFIPFHISFIILLISRLECVRIKLINKVKV